MTPPIPDRVAQRALTKFVVNEDGCHISTYSVASHGYAQVGWREDGKTCMTTAHRAAWVAHVGRQVGDGNEVDHHKCSERRCVNPAHLRELTKSENSARTNGRDWPLGQCANGHPRVKARHCPQCKADIQRRYRARNAL